MSGRGKGGMGLGKGGMFHFSSGRGDFAPIELIENGQVQNGEAKLTIEPTLKRKREIKNSPNKEAKIESPQFEPASQDEWRNWLALNHEKEKGVWVIFFKNNSNRTDILGHEELV